MNVGMAICTCLDQPNHCSYHSPQISMGLDLVGEPDFSVLSYFAFLCLIM